MNNSFSEVYGQLADRLAAQLPGVWVDLNQGQLDNEAAEYPLPYHLGVVLLEFEEIDWEELGRGVQRGDCLIRVLLARQVAEDSYQFSAQRAGALGHLEQLGQIHRALQHFAGTGFGALVRTNSRKEPGPPGRWVYSQAYRCRLHDEVGVPAAGGVVENLDTTPRPGARPAPTPGPFIIG